MSESPTSKYLQVFPGSTTEHAEAVMSTRHIPSKNTVKTVYLTLDDLPQMVYPGHPGHNWLSIAVESGVDANAVVAVAPFWKASSGDEGGNEPLVAWSCAFEIGDKDPDRLQERVDDLLTRYLRAGFKMSPSLVRRPGELVTDRNMLALALSDEHLELMGREKGATPLLLTGKSVDMFEVNNLRVVVRDYHDDYAPRPSLGAFFKGIFASPKG